MLFIILLLFLFFLIIYCYPCIKNNSNIIENMDDLSGNTCASDRGIYLGLNNAAKISSINEQLEKLNNLNQRFTNVENKVNANYNGINILTKKLSKYTSSLSN